MRNDVKVIHVANNNNNNTNDSTSKGDESPPYVSDDDADLPSVSSLSNSDSEDSVDSVDSVDSDDDSDVHSDSDNGTASIVHGGAGDEGASEIDTDDFLSQDPLYLVLSQFFLTGDKKRNITGVMCDLVDRLDKLMLMLGNKA
jgi:hypothetical protein